jgi:hypothetical protein
MMLSETGSTRKDGMKKRIIPAAALAAALALTIGYARADTITGCLKGPNSEGVYELTTKQAAQAVEVGGDPDLAKHVGHTVKLTGDWAKTGAEIGEKQEGPEEKEERHFKVTAVEHLAVGCK